MTRASPCRRLRADRADGVSFDITKTNSSATFSVLATAMLLDMASDFLTRTLTRTLNCLAVQNRGDEKAEWV